MHITPNSGFDELVRVGDLVAAGLKLIEHLHGPEVGHGSQGVDAFGVDELRLKEVSVEPVAEVVNSEIGGIPLRLHRPGGQGCWAPAFVLGNRPLGDRGGAHSVVARDFLASPGSPD